MTNAQKRNIQSQISTARAIINHDAVGAGVLQKKIKHRMNRLSKAIHTR